MRLNKKHPPINPRDRKISFSGLNDLIESTPRQIVSGDGVGVTYMGDRIHVRNTQVPNGIPDHRNYYGSFRVLKVYDDYLLVEALELPAFASNWEPYEYNSGSATATAEHNGLIYAALPMPFRRSFWDGLTLTTGGIQTTYEYQSLHSRKVITPGSSWVESIHPRYGPGDVVVAVWEITGLDDLDDYPVIWHDINSAARRWSEPNNVCYMDLVINVCPKVDGEGNVVGLRKTRGKFPYLSPTGCSPVQVYEEDEDVCETGSATGTDRCIRDCFRVSINGVDYNHETHDYPDILLFNRVWKLRNDPTDSCVWQETIAGSYVLGSTLTVRLEYCEDPATAPLLYLIWELDGLVLQQTMLLLDAVPPWDCKVSISSPFIPPDFCNGSATATTSSSPITWPTSLSVEAIDCDDVDDEPCGESDLADCYSIDFGVLSGLFSGLSGVWEFATPFYSIDFDGGAVTLIQGPVGSGQGPCPWFLRIRLIGQPCIAPNSELMDSIFYRIRPDVNGTFPALESDVPYSFDLWEISEAAMSEGNFPLTLTVNLCPEGSATASASASASSTSTATPWNCWQFSILNVSTFEITGPFAACFDGDPNGTSAGGPLVRTGAFVIAGPYATEAECIAASCEAGTGSATGTCTPANCSGGSFTAVVGTFDCYAGPSGPNLADQGGGVYSGSADGMDMTLDSSVCPAIILMTVDGKDAYFELDTFDCSGGIFTFVTGDVGCDWPATVILSTV